MADKSTVETEMMLRSAPPDPHPAPARFRYDPADPYAVQATFHTEAEPHTATWTFARELLATGLDQPAGLGDVQVWPSPWATPHGDLVILALCSPDGQATLEVPRTTLLRFLCRTYVLVPRGQEGHHQNIDIAIAHLLSG